MKKFIIMRSTDLAYKYVRLDKWETPVYDTDIHKAKQFSTEEEAEEVVRKFHLVRSHYEHIILCSDDGLIRAVSVCNLVRNSKGQFVLEIKK